MFQGASRWFGLISDMTTERFQIGEVQLNTGTQQVTLNGEVVPLPPLSFSLLHELARNAPNLVTPRQLEEAVWSGLVVDRGTINKRVLLVRKALEEAGCESDYISVVRGTGYRMAVPVERLDREQNEDSGMACPRVFPRPRLGNLAWTGLVVVLLAAAYTLGHYRLSPGYGEQAAGSIPQPGTRVTAAPDLSIAVLPFSTDSTSEAQRYFADGITRELTGLLNAISKLQVTDSALVTSISSQHLSPRETAARLGVRNLLQGSIREDDRSIHLAASLTDAFSGHLLWSQNFDGDLNDVFRIQDRLVSGVAAAMNVRLAKSEQPNSGSPVTDNVAAFTLYLQGRGLLDDRIERGQDNIREALAKFWQAADMQPDFVRAHIGIAKANLLLPIYDSTLNENDYLEQARTSAMYALNLDPASATATGVLAAIDAEEGQVTEAAALFKRSLAMGNSDPNVFHWQAMLLNRMGYFDTLVDELEKAYQREPMNPYLGCSLAIALEMGGHPQASEKVLGELGSFPTRNYLLAMAQIYLGDLSDARVNLRNIQLTTGVLPARFADVLVDGFEDAKKRGQAESLLQNAARDGDLPAPVAFESLLILGSPAAFDVNLGSHGDLTSRGLLLPVWNNWGVALRKDARFKEWVRRLGYDDYWRKNGWPDRCRPTSLTDFECI